MRLPYSGFDDSSSDDGAGDSADALMLRDDGDADHDAGTPGDDGDVANAFAVGNDGMIFAPPAEGMGDASNTPPRAHDLFADGTGGVFDTSAPASAASFDNVADQDSLPGGPARSEPVFDSHSAGTTSANTERVPSVSGRPAPGLSGKNGGSISGPALSESPGGESEVSDAKAGSTSGPAAASPHGGTLPLVGDLGVIYQAPTPMQSDSGGSSGSSPASMPSGNSSGFIINVSYDQNVSSLPAGFVAAINYVVSYYESIFTAPITVNIDVGYGEIDGQQLQSDALGESETFLGDYSYSSIVNALAGVDASAAASLPASMPVSGTMWIGTAEAKALGLSLEQPSTDIDGFAGFSDVFPFTYDPNNRAVPGEYDFIGVVEHEFTEVMGRIDLFGDSIGGTTAYSLLDMFHYTAPGQHTYTGLTTNYFSANGGTTDLDNFNDNPDGDLGDWASSAGANSYLAFTPTGQEDVVSQSDISEMNALGYSSTGQSSGGNSTPQPAGTTANLIMERGTDGAYEIYDLGNNEILAASDLGQISTQWQVDGLGRFDGTDTSDLLLRNSSGTLEVYDVANNTLTGNVTLGQIGSEWAVVGLGDFSSRAGETDMLMRDGNTGAFEVYDISSNAITYAVGMGQVGLNWQVAGLGDFSGRPGETGDMLMRNSSTGQFEVYDISNNTIISAAGIGNVGLEWQVVGFGDFSGHANETDMLMRDGTTDAFEIYDIANNQITFTGSIGQVGLEWQVVGIGPMGGAGASDMLMRDSNTGEFELYDIANNQITNSSSIGQVGNEWSVAGIAADSTSGSSPANAQLAQAIASYAPTGGGGDNGAMLGQPTAQSGAASPFAASNNLAHPAD